ncbi:methyl jasmonate esterase 1-like [Andrographis paniculata]|uniref:methyl jasmonate esterase 1-like n=1 Tax=Andrographis paniculata TaxID=175694 RepID=UPI0021E7C061|nr:methyl jasmonate esterase 1-like [Andrographis paniculata]
MNCHHFVLVHGGGHGAWCWYKVVTLLRSGGHTATALDLASCGRDPRRVEEIPAIEDYVEPLFQFMEGLPAGEKVVLVGHSRGGIDISMATERFPEKVAVAVFVTASMPSPSLDVSTITKKFREQFGPPMDNEFTSGQGIDGRPLSIARPGPEFMASMMYNLSPPEDLTLARLLVRPAPHYEEILSPSTKTALTDENYGRVRRAYIVCPEDKVMKEEIQRWLIEENPPDEVRVIDGSDHMVMMSKPEELSSFLMEIAAKYCHNLNV